MSGRFLNLALQEASKRLGLRRKLSERDFHFTGLIPPDATLRTILPQFLTKVEAWFVSEPKRRVPWRGLEVAIQRVSPGLREKRRLGLTLFQMAEESAL